MSSATASGRDCVPSDKPKLKSRMCLFVITQKDGTPLDATSVTKEDIVEMCIKMGHTHPLGVLHYSTTELIALFCSTEEMQCTTCGAIKVMELWEEAIAVRALAPSETHVKACIIAVGGDSSKLQSPHSEEEGEPHLPHDNPHPSGGNAASSPSAAWPPYRSWTASAIGGSPSGDHTPQVEHTPAALHQCLGDNHQGVVMLKGVTRRSPFWEGEGGFPQDNHPISYPCITRWGMGSSGTTSTAPTSCSTKSRHGALNKCSGIRFTIGYPQNKHLQWQSHIR